MLLLMFAILFNHTHDVFARLMLCVCYVQDMFRRLGDGPPVLRRLRCMHRLLFSTQDLLYTLHAIYVEALHLWSVSPPQSRRPLP